jgi:hypothetical protein
MGGMAGVTPRVTLALYKLPAYRSYSDGLVGHWCACFYGLCEAESTKPQISVARCNAGLGACQSCFGRDNRSAPAPVATAQES